jgi:hypothetical protein
MLLGIYKFCENRRIEGQALHRTAWPLKMGPTGCPETSVTNYQSALCNIPEERRPYEKSLVSRIEPMSSCT